MSNELQIFGGTDLLDDATLREQLAVNADVGARGEGISYMSFSGKRGIYKIGIDGRAPGEDEPFLVAIPLFKVGWICWKGGKPLDKRMAGSRDPAIVQPAADELGPFDKDGDGWSRARSIAARSLLNGEEVEFTNNSKSGVSEMAALHRDVRDRLRETNAVWPVVKFGVEEFESQGYKNFKPTIEVIAWLTRDDIVKWTDDPDFDPMSLLEGADVEAAPEPKRRNL